MSTTAIHPIAEHEHDAASGAHVHDPTLAHHFATHEQQFAAGKLGIWLFLITEVLFFSGLFVAYAIYRRNHPEVFVYAHQYLDTALGAFNTAVLLLSSLTMAWAVRAAQLGQQRLLVGLLTATLACASLFLGVKAVEYSHKWDAGILWAAAYAPMNDEHKAATDSHEGGQQHSSAALSTLSTPPAVAGGVFLLIAATGAVLRRRKLLIAGLCLSGVAAAFFAGVFSGQLIPMLAAQTHDVAQAAVEPRLVGIFFSIYYVMTGLHAIHILAGMGVITWLLVSSLRGRFGPSYFGPVDYVGLYWHLVDLVWIYLFPLLYLIH